MYIYLKFLSEGISKLYTISFVIKVVRKRTFIVKVHGSRFTVEKKKILKKNWGKKFEKKFLHEP